MKLSCVAFSASALALTASAAIIPLQSPTSIKSRSTHKDENIRDHHHTKESMNIRKQDMRRSRIRSMMYVDGNRHMHGSDVVVESHHGHGHDTVAIPLHHHSVEYVEGRVHRDHKRSKYYSYLPGVPYPQAVGAPVMTRVITSKPKVAMIPEYVPGRTHTSIHEVSYMNLPPSPKVAVIPGYVPGRGHTSIHQHIHYRRKSQHGSPKSNSPKRFSIKHGKPGKSRSQQGDTEADDSKKQKHSGDSSESEPASKRQSHEESSKSNKKPGKHSQLSERSISTSGSVTQSGVPGFIEVATPLFKSALAKAVSGLTYSTTNGSNFDLTTSDTQSTQFFMSPMNNTVGQAAFQLRIPILDSTAFQTVDHCATFSLSAPGPLSLKKCGPVPGCSQAFSYNDVSGKIEPIYGSNAAPSNSNSTSQSSSSSNASSSGRYRMTQMNSSANSTSMSNSSTPSNATTSNDSTSNRTAPLFTQDSSAYQNSLNGSSDSFNSSMTIQNGTAQDNVTASGTHSFLATPESTSLNSTSTEAQKDSPSPPAALYFVPAQGFYQAPATIDQVLDSSSSAATAASPVPIGRNVVAGVDDGSDDDDDDDDDSDQVLNRSVIDPVDGSDDDDDDDDSDQVLNRSVIDPVTGAAGAAGAPVPATPNNRSGVNTEQVLGDGNNAGEDVAETQDEVKSDEAEDAAIIAPQ